VLPLPRSPQAGTPLCTLPGCGRFPASSEHFEHDPEPHDVGHPEPEPLCHRTRPADAHPASRCTWCGWLWEQHSPAPSAPRQLVGCECGHRWGVHGGGKCHAWDGAKECGCTRRTQADINNGVRGQSADFTEQHAPECNVFDCTCGGAL
jgi:hypothetical protein